VGLAEDFHGLAAVLLGQAEFGGSQGVQGVQEQGVLVALVVEHYELAALHAGELDEVLGGGYGLQTEERHHSLFTNIQYTVYPSLDLGLSSVNDCVERERVAVAAYLGAWQLAEVGKPGDLDGHFIGL